MASKRAAGAASAAGARVVPPAVAVSLYRQLLRSARAYAHEASQRSLKLGAELPRLLALPSAAEHSAATTSGGASSAATASTAASAAATSSGSLSCQLDAWVKEKPFLFHHLIIAERKQQQKLQQGDKEEAADATATAATQTTTTAAVAAAASSSPAVAAHSDPARPASTPSRPAAPAAALGTAPPSDGDSGGDGADAPARPSPPPWVLSMRRSGASLQPLQRSLLTGLLRRAFRLRPADGKEASARLSNAFALSKRLAERTSELRLLPLAPLRSWSCGGVPGLVRVELRSRAFKRVRHTYFFGLQWRVRNISDDRNIVLVQRKIITHQRAIGGAGLCAGSGGGIGVGSASATAGSGSALLVGAGMGSAGLGNGLGGINPLGQRCTSTTLPASAAAAAAANRAPPHPPASAVGSTATATAHVAPSACGAGLRVESIGTGLAGRALALPAGSSVERQHGLVCVDGSSGTMAAELTFNDVTSVPPRTFTVQLPLLLLDAKADWMGALEDEEAPPDDDEEGTYVPPLARGAPLQPTTRHMLSSAWRAEADKLSRDERSQNRTESDPPAAGDDHKPAA